MTTTPMVDATPSAPGAPPPSEGLTERLKSALRGNVRQYGMVVALAAIVILFQIWTSGILLKPLNVTNIVQQNGYILILAIGMVMVLSLIHISEPTRQVR